MKMILIVDDDTQSRRVLEKLLRFAGHESESASGGVEALAMLRHRKPALMILDVHMPEMDGLTVLRTIKEHDGLKDIPVLMCSADSTHETMAAAKRLGAADYFVKGSVWFDHLMTRIGEFAGEPPHPGQYAV
jgi:CheY-like chemotaxis protein